MWDKRPLGMQSTPREFLYFLGHLHIGQLLIALLAVQMDCMLVFILRFQSESNRPAPVLLLQMLQKCFPDATPLEGRLDVDIFHPNAKPAVFRGIAFAVMA